MVTALFPSLLFRRLMLITSLTPDTTADCNLRVEEVTCYLQRVSWEIVPECCTKWQSRYNTAGPGSWYLSGVTSVAGCSNSGRSNSGSGVQHFSSRQHITKEVIHIHKVWIMNVSTQVIGTPLWSENFLLWGWVKLALRGPEEARRQDMLYLVFLETPPPHRAVGTDPVLLPPARPR